CWPPAQTPPPPSSPMRRARKRCATRPRAWPST
ncbi:MAG: hypothetical protein AVDCRST_MAG89-1465, partial [uncultured Gemmatimonadetes bacterium]